MENNSPFTAFEQYVTAPSFYSSGIGEGHFVESAGAFGGFKAAASSVLFTADNATSTAGVPFDLRGSAINLKMFNNTTIAAVTSTGVAVTGTLSATGNVTGANLSGTNTGDQFTSIPTATFIGRNTAGTGVAEQLTVAQAKTLLNLAGSNTGDQFTNMNTARLLGRTTAGTGASEELTSAQVKALLNYVAADIAYTALETGGTSRTLQQKFGDFLYPQDFGCVCDGTTDDTVNFQKAVNASALGRKILFMPKTIKLGAITVPANTSIMGPEAKCIINSLASTYVGFLIQGSDIAFSNLQLEDAAKTGGHDFVLDCSTAGNKERISWDNINAFNSWGGISDTGTVSMGITLRITKCQWRAHRGPGIRWTRSFAFTFHHEVAIDYVGVAGTSANHIGFYYDGNGLGAGAGGVFWTQCDVLGTMDANVATPVNVDVQHGWRILNTGGVGLAQCRADGVGGFGYDMVNIITIHFVNTSASHCGNHHYQFDYVRHCTGIGCVAFGRIGASEPVTDGFRFLGTSGSFAVSFTGGFISDFKGGAIHKATNQSGVIQFSDYYISGSANGVFTVGASPFVVSDCTFAGNTSNYTLAAGSNFLVQCLVGTSIISASSAGTIDTFAPVDSRNITPLNVNLTNDRSSNYNLTTPGGAAGGVHFNVPTIDGGNAVTFSTNGSGALASAGVYGVGTSAVGSRLLLGTTDNFATGVKTAVDIDHLGKVSVKRGAFNLTPMAAPATPANGDLWYDSTALKFKKHENGVTSDISPTGAGSGTVTSVSVVTANGVSGTVATDTTTPAITLSLGAITPSSVVVSGLTQPQGGVLDSGTVAARLQNTGATAPTGSAGIGLELIGSNGTGSLVQSRNRTTALFTPITLSGLSLDLATDGVTRLTITAAGASTFSGTLAASNLSGTNTGDETKASIDTKLGATGGTTFYRKDGTWAVAGGSTDPLLLATETSTDAPASGTPATGVTVFAALRANRRQPAIISPTGRSERLQAFLGSNDIMMVDVPAGGTLYDTLGAAMATDVGTATTPAITTTNNLTMQVRRVLSVAATVNLPMEVKALAPWCSRRLVGGGFHFTMRFGLETVLPATGRLLAGFRSVITAHTTADPRSSATNPNAIAVMKNSADTALSLNLHGAASAQTISLTNTGVTGWNVAGTLFQLELFCKPGDAGFGYRVTRYSPNGASAPIVTYDEGYITTGILPVIDTLFVPHLWAQNVAATATSLAFIQMYKESD